MAAASARRSSQVPVQVDKPGTGDVPAVIEFAARGSAQPPAHVEQRRAVQGGELFLISRRVGAEPFSGADGKQAGQLRRGDENVSRLFGHRLSMTDAADER